MSERLFSFGVSSVDSLINPSASSPLGYNFHNDTFVGCIVGPDGVGKSIFGLHAASNYVAEKQKGIQPIVVYASTDLSWRQATASWKSFGLDRPNERQQLLASHFGTKSSPQPVVDSCELAWVSPHLDIMSLSAAEKELNPLRYIFDQYHCAPNDKESKVHFLDLAKYSAGDDWGLINRTLGLFADLDENADSRAQRPPHLLIIDAVEGLEAMVGEHDGFGLKRSRRSRLAQLVRVSRKVRCNVLFIIEQREDDVHLDEVFIADLVIRLRTVLCHGYQQKTIEIEKARGISHTRGQHEFQIRSGRPCEGGGACPDEPEMKLEGIEMPYLQTLPSLDVKPSLPVANSEVFAPPQRWFGIEEIDAWFKPNKRTSLDLGNRQRICVIVGESNSFKSQLALHFAANAFLEPNENGAPSMSNSGVVIISSEGLLQANAASTIYKILRRNSVAETEIETLSNSERLNVRHISPRFISSAGFIFRVRTCIQRMKEKLGISKALDSLRVRVVVDNWTTLLDGHPALRDDPRVLQTLVALFRDEGVAACIVSTQPGSPTAPVTIDRAHDPTELDVAKVHVWPIDFFGSRRVAVGTSFSTMRFNEPSIYELKMGDDDILTVDTDFALYENVDHGTAKRIPLRLRLYGGFLEHDGNVDVTKGYANRVVALFNDLFPNSEHHESVVQFAPISKYAELKAHVQATHGTRLDHTLVFQVDEFWKANDGIGLADLSGFLPVTSTQEQGNDRKKPLYKDFGFLLAERDAWQKCKDSPIGSFSLAPKKKNSKDSKEEYYICKLVAEDLSVDVRYYPWTPLPELDSLRANEEVQRANDVEPTPKLSLRVGHIWNSLCLPENRLDMEHSINLFPTWELYFAAAHLVANNVRRPAFDFDLRTSETVCSLVLEVWLSKICEMTGATPEQLEKTFRDWSLSDFIAGCGEYLFDSVRLVKGMMPLAEPSGFDLSIRPPNLNSISVRTWFGSAKRCQLEKDGLAPLGLPGRVSVRGDWFLGVAAGSRSLLLASQAIENLCTKQMDILRAQEGVGLPVQNLEGAGPISTALTTPLKGAGGSRPVTLSEISKQLEPSLQGPRFPWRRSNICRYGMDGPDFFGLLQELFRLVEVRPPDPNMSDEFRMPEVPGAPSAADNVPTVSSENLLLMKHGEIARFVKENKSDEVMKEFIRRLGELDHSRRAVPPEIQSRVAELFHSFGERCPPCIAQPKSE